jgi:hypothetical protein
MAKHPNGRIHLKMVWRMTIQVALLKLSDAVDWYPMPDAVQDNEVQRVAELSLELRLLDLDALHKVKALPFPFLASLTHL